MEGIPKGGKRLVENGKGPGGYLEFSFERPTRKYRKRLRAVLFALGLSLVPSDVDREPNEDQSEPTTAEQSVTQGGLQPNELPAQMHESADDQLTTAETAVEAAHYPPERPIHPRDPDTWPHSTDGTFVFETLPDMDGGAAERALAAEMAWVEMPYNSILIKGPDSTPLALVPFQSTVQGEGEDAYLIGPGKTDENGFLEGGIASEFISAVEVQVAQGTEFAPEEMSQANIDSEITSVLAAEDSRAEPLQNAIRSGEVNILAEMVDFMGGEKVDGTNKSIIEYLRTEADLRSIPEPLASQLREYLPAVCAEESRFKP